MSEPANFDLANQKYDEAITAARDTGVDEGTISALTANTHESNVQGTDVQEAIEVTQDVPVGEDLQMDFGAVPTETNTDPSNLDAAFGQQTPVTNPFIKQVIGEEVNDPIIFNNKLNKITAYEMGLNNLKFPDARSKAESMLQRTTVDEAMKVYKQQIAGQMELDWKDYIQTADPQEIISYHDFMKEHSLVEAYEGKLGDEKLFVDTFGGLTLDEEREANTIIKGYAGQLLSERVDKIGMTDWATSVAGVFVPDYLKDVNDLVDVGIFQTKESYFNFIEGFKQSTPDQKARILDLYVPKVWNAFDENPIKAAGAINILFDEDHETSFWIDAGFDAVDFTGFGFDLVKLGAGGYAVSKLLRGVGAGKALKGTSNIKMKYRDVENPSAATEVTASSKADESGTVQQGNAQTELDEATDVSAVNTERTTLSDNSVDGLADAHTRLFEQVRYNKTSSPFQQNVLSQLDRNRMAGMQRGLDALIKRHRTNIQKAKQKLAKEEKPKFRTVTPDESAELITKGYRTYSHTEDAVTMVRASDSVMQLQKALVNDSRKLQKVIEQNEDIKNQLRYADIASRSSEDARALARGEIPKGSEELVRKEEEALTILYKGLSKNSQEAVKAGLARESAQQIVTNIRDKMNSLKNSLDDIMPEMLDAAEKTAIERATIEKLQKASDDSGKVIRSIDIVDRDRKGFKAKITYENGSAVEEVHFTENDIGDFGIDRGDITANLVQTWGAKIFSPEHQFDAADRTGRFGGLVRDATFAGGQADRIKRALNVMARDITLELSRKNRGQLDRLVLASDEASTETERLFTIRELQEGIETAKGLEIIHPSTIDAYYKMHLFLGETKRLMDWSVRRSLEVKGFKNLSFVDKGKMRQSIVKPVKNWGSVDFTAKQKVMIYDEAMESWGTMEASELVRKHESYKDDGYQLVEFFSKEADSAGNVTSHGLIPPDTRIGQVGELPQSVLNTTKGMYIPRVYKPGYYYVRDAGDARKNTVLAFERKSDADRYVDKKNAEGGRFQALRDGDMGYEDSMVALAQGYGGLYTSARKRENLKMVASGKDPDTELSRPERLGGIDSIQRYMDATGNMMPMGEQRIVAVRRFENQLDRVATQMGYSRGLETPGDFNSKILLPDSSPEKAMFESMRDFIKGTYGTMTSQEKAFQGLMDSVVSVMDKGSYVPIVGGFAESGRKLAVQLAHADVRRKLLGATFDAHLGWFGGAQLYVQAQNAALAMSMHPIDGIKAIPEAFAARTILFNSSDRDIGDLSKIVTKGLGINNEEFVDTVRAFRRSGLYDSIMRVADYGGKAAGIGGDALDTFRTAAKAGRLFYEEGEMFSRLISFMIAKQNLKRNIKGFDIKDPANVKQLSDETYRIMMNMQKENAAAWQNNWLSIPLQFAQVQAKLIENILPAAFGGSKRWTAKEKLAVLTGQVALYGAVGVPLVEQASNYMMGYLDVEPMELKENSPQALEFIQEGFTGVISQALGFENNFSDRGSIIKGMDDNAVGKFISGVYRTMKYKDDEVNLRDFMGASLNTYYRGAEAGGQLVESVNNIFYKPTGKVMVGELGKVSDAFMAITSTWSNKQKEEYIHSSGLHSGNGNLMIPESEFDMNFRSRVARIMGFAYDKETAFYNTTNAQMAYQRDWKYIRQAMKRRMLEQIRTPGDQDLYERDMIHLGLPLTEMEYDKMMDTIIQETISGDSTLDKQMKTQLRLHLSGAIQQTPLQGIE